MLGRRTTPTRQLASMLRFGSKQSSSGARTRPAIEFRYTDDPNAPAVMIREEDILKNYHDVREIDRGDAEAIYGLQIQRCISSNQESCGSDKRYAYVRHVNPDNPKSTKQRFYNPNIFQEFDKHYTRRKK